MTHAGKAPLVRDLRGGRRLESRDLRTQAASLAAEIRGINGRRINSVGALPDADNLRWSPDGNRLFLGFGEELATIDPATMSVLSRAKLPGHPEAFEPAAHGPEIYVNVPQAKSVVVIDRVSGKTIGSWSVRPYAGNFPIALDEASHRLFVGTRSPARLLSFDTNSGQRVLDTALCGDVDDLFLDLVHRRVYAICGEGFVDVLADRGDGQFKVVQHLASAAGARTGLFVPASDALYVAAPERGAKPARILKFRTR